MRVSVAYEFLPKRPSAHAAMVMDHFGVGFDAGRHVIADNVELPIEPGDLVLFTGASGSGKSSLLRAAAEQLSVIVPSPVDGETIKERGFGSFGALAPSPWPSPPRRGRGDKTGSVLNI